MHIPLDLIMGSSYISPYSDYKCISLYHYFLYCRYYFDTTWGKSFNQNLFYKWVIKNLDYIGLN